MDNARKTAVKTLNEVLYDKAYSSISLSNNINNADLNAADSGLTTEIVYGTIKYKYTIDKILSSFIKKPIEKNDKSIINILRITIYQLRYLTKIPDFAAVNEAVNLCRAFKKTSAASFVNGVLRNYLRNVSKEFVNKNDNIHSLCFEYSFPEWLVKKFIKQYGIDIAGKILKGLNETPALTVRVNTLRTNTDHVYREMIENGYIVERGKLCPEALIIYKGGNIENNPLFKEGKIYIQDESAMLVGTIIEASENMSVLDLCSAPGGKCTHFAQMMNNKGIIKAFDIHKNKLSLIKDNCLRLGISNITCDVMDAGIYNKDLFCSSDRVAIDVPCSGLGIIRKKPEIKWNKSDSEIKKLIEIQRKIMHNGSLYLKNNGKLIYSTCTLNKEENEENVEWFIKNHPDFSIEKIELSNKENVINNPKGFITLLPDKYKDGFFIAKFVKNKQV